MKSYEIERAYPTLFQLHELKWRRERKQMLQTMFITLMLYGAFAFMMFN